MALILDHINGIGDDHRLENLQVVCPNCSKPTRIGHRKNDEGRSVRVCRKCDAEI